jgi:hypothetical protein
MLPWGSFYDKKNYFFIYCLMKNTVEMKDIVNLSKAR